MFPRAHSNQQWTNQQRGYYNFDQAFANQQNLIDRTDFTNHNNVIHNNLGPNLLAEHISEYKLRLNSADRNVQITPSIYKQQIIFDKSCGGLRNFKNVKYIQIDSVLLPKSSAIDISKIVIPDSAFDSSKNLINQSVVVSDIYPSNTQYNQNFNVSGTLSGNITWNGNYPSSGYFTGTIATTSVTNLTQTLTGTIYVSSYNSSTSKYMGTCTFNVHEISETLNGTIEETTILSDGSLTANFVGTLSFLASALPSTLTSSYAWNHPYIFVKVEEMSTDKNMGTSTIVSNSTYLYKYDRVVGNDMVLWKPIQSSTTIFQGSRLGNLSKLNISILDEHGQEFYLTDLEGNRLIGNSLNLLNSNVSSYYTGDYNNFVQTFFNTPSVKRTNTVTQVIIGMTVGVVENELNTQTNY